MSENASLQAVQAEIKSIEQAIMPLLRTQSDEIKRHGETSIQTRDALKALETKYDERMRDLDAIRQDVTAIKSDLGERAKPGRRISKSAGEAFVESDAYKGVLGTSLERVTPVSVPSFHRKALFTADPLGEIDAFTYPNARVWDFVTEPERDLHIRDLLPVIPTSSPALDYVVRTGNRWTAGVQESEGDVKLEQALAFEVKQATPVTIAHWLPITKQAIRRTPQLRAYIDNELRYGIKLKEDEQLLYGDGSAGNLTGLMVNAHVQTYNRGVVGDTRIDTLRRAVTQLRVLHFRSTGVVINPTDWEAIELQKDNEDRYLWVTVPEGGVQRLWRVPVIDTVAMNADEFLMGDWRIAAHLWDLEAARVEVGYKDDDFVRNRLVVLGEEDIIFTTELPRGFVKGDFTAASS